MKTAALVLLAAMAAGPPAAQGLVARVFNSGFPEAHDTCNGIHLGFTLGPDRRTPCDLTGGPAGGGSGAARAKVAMGVARGVENLHLVTYDMAARGYRDHGPVFYPDGGRPTFVNSIAVGADGTVYTLARVTEGGRTRTDLVRIRVGG